MEKKIIIRAAERGDCKSLKEMSEELARYEKMSNGSQLDVEVWERDGFGENPLFHCFVAECDGELVGYITYHDSYSTFDGKSMYMDGLYVQPSFRKNGVGSLLFDALAKKAADENCGRFDFLVLNTNPAADFYKRKGVTDVTKNGNWHVYRMTRDDLKKTYCQ